MTDAGPDSAHVLVAEDDPAVARLIARTLAEYRYEVTTLPTGSALLTQMRTRPADLCILDLGLPDMDGLTLVRALMAEFDTAILILTGRHDVSDRVVGLELGADDYMVKPFEPRELVARVRSILRRAARGADRGAAAAKPAPGGAKATVARFAGWTFRADINELEAADGTRIGLSAAEARLLMVFLRAPNRILSREQLLPDAADAPFDRSIDVRVSRLRRKIEPDPREAAIIKTVYGAGYLLAAEVAWP